MKKLYLIARKFETNKGSYAGVFEELSKQASKNYEVIILCGLFDNQKKTEKLNNAKVIRFPITQGTPPLLGLNNHYFSLSKHLKKYFKENPPEKKDIIFVNSRAALGVPGKYILRMGQPSFTFLKNMEIARSEVGIFSRLGRYIHHLIMHFMENITVKRASALVVSSEKSRQNIVKLYGGNKKSYFIPFSGVKFDHFKKGKKKKLKGRNILFISAGTERIRKGVIYLERALPDLFENYKDLNLVHVGKKFDWRLSSKYKNRINSVGKIPWERMRDYYKTADVFVMTSIQEGFPNTVLEAMASGCPIVTSDIDGIREYIEHKKSGYIFKRGSVNSLKKGMSFMLENPKKRIEFSKLVQDKAKRLEYKRYSKNLLNFFEKVYSEKKTKNVNLLK